MNPVFFANKSQPLFEEAKALAAIATTLTDDFRPERSSNFSGKTEWEYEARRWHRGVLPLIGGAPGVAFQMRVAHFVVEAKAFLRNIQALRFHPTACHDDEAQLHQILYDDHTIPFGWENSWNIFLEDYETVRKAFDGADLECEDSDCGPVDEIAMPGIPILRPYWSADACKELVAWSDYER